MTDRPTSPRTTRPATTHPATDDATHRRRPDATSGWGRVATLAARIDRATPADRDRPMDLLRVASMAVVALGHWVMAVVWLDADGALAATSLLAAAPWTQAATLLLQVMGLFFAVGGWASARSLARSRETAGAWVHARARRLLAPTTAYVVTAAVLVPAVAGAVGPDVVAVARRAFTIHLWFVATVVPLYLLTPALHAAWRATGPRLLVVLGAGAFLVDVAHRVVGLPLVGWVNFGLVWGAATVLGFAWADGLLVRRVARRMVLLGGVAVASLVATPWIPLAMVGVDGAARSNNSPPSVVLLALTVVHVGAAVLATPTLRRWTARPVVWAAVVLAGRGAVTVYLWHLLGMGLAITTLTALAPRALAVEPLTTTWWLSRPLWLAGLALATVPLVALALRWETRLPAVDPPTGGRVVVAALLATAGTALLVTDGVTSVTGAAAVVVAAAVGRWLPRTAPR